MMKIFIDFDGTITQQDVGDSMFERFGGIRCRDIIRQYHDGLISAVECYRRESAACGIVNRRELDDFIDGREIDPTFVEFLSFCRQHNIECLILSDGMDYYIKRILGNNGIRDISFYSNILGFDPVDGRHTVRFVPSFPYRDEVCDRCASCKRNHMLTLSGDDDVIVYIGEGYSDRCPARYADVVFAKDELLVYCKEENLSFYEYRTFNDVIQRLEKMSGIKHPLDKFIGFHKRRRAELERRGAFLGG